MIRLRLYMLIRSFNLIDGYPIGREGQQRAWIGFNESTPGVLSRGPVSGDPRAPSRTGTQRAEGAMQVIKLLVRSCHHWQLKVCKQFYELIAARHAPRVSRPTSNPGRPRENTPNRSGGILAACACRCLNRIDGPGVASIPAK